MWMVVHGVCACVKSELEHKEEQAERGCGWCLE